MKSLWIPADINNVDIHLFKKSFVVFRPYVWYLNFIIYIFLYSAPKAWNGIINKDHILYGEKMDL